MRWLDIISRGEEFDMCVDYLLSEGYKFSDIVNIEFYRKSYDLVCIIMDETNSEIYFDRYSDSYDMSELYIEYGEVREIGIGVLIFAIKMGLY
jgi:hypothetical protein